MRRRLTVFAPPKLDEKEDEELDPAEMCNRRHYQEMRLKDKVTANKMFDKLRPLNERDINIASLEILPLFVEVCRMFIHPELVKNDEKKFDTE